MEFLTSDTNPTTHRLLLSSSDEINVSITVNDTTEAANYEQLEPFLSSVDSQKFLAFNEIYNNSKQKKTDKYGNDTPYLHYVYRKRPIMVKPDSIIAIHFIQPHDYA